MATDKKFPFFWWICGSAVGLFAIAIFHPCLFHKSMVFIPLSIFFTLQILLYLSLVIANIFIDVDGNSPILFFFEGMLDCPCCFYMYFLIPLKIATHYRLTQEVTSAATVVAVSISITYVLGRFFYVLLNQIV